MALETPPRFSRQTSAPEPPAVPRFAGDDAVPRGLAIASAVTLRLLIVFAGIVVLAIAAQRMLLVVLPLIIAMLLTTLLEPLARWLERRRWRPAPAAAVAVVAALLVFAGLWALIIPAALDQGSALGAKVQEGAGQVADVLKPVGIDSSDLDRAVHEASATAKKNALPAAMLAAQWAGAIVLIAVLTFLLVKDGAMIWRWIVELFHEDRQPALDEIGRRCWDALATYVRGLVLVATIDALFIGAGLLVVGVWRAPRPCWWRSRPTARPGRWPSSPSS
jgi:putative heme transporter